MRICGNNMSEELTYENYLHGKFKMPNIEAEIHTRLKYVSIQINGDEYFWQGLEAEIVIKMINTLYNHYDVPVEEAIERFCDIYL